MEQPVASTGLAQATTPLTTAQRSDYCIFLRDGLRFALSTRYAKEVLEARPVTPVPHAPPELLGAFNLRGEVVPLVSLDHFLGVPVRPIGREDTLLLLSHADVALAAVVDQVVTIKHISPWEIRRAKLDQSAQNPLIRGRYGREQEQALVFDGERLLASVVEHIAAGLRGRARMATPLMTAAPEGSAVMDAARGREIQPQGDGAVGEVARSGPQTGEDDPR